MIALESQSFVTELNDNDVLMGRGSPSSEYTGNLRFRQLVIDRREDYLKCSRRNDKHRIAMEIIQAIHDRGGRFLQRITTLEEAERLHVPPRVQAWKIIAASSPLFVKVKQLMRDVGKCRHDESFRKICFAKQPTFLLTLCILTIVRRGGDTKEAKNSQGRKKKGSEATTYFKHNLQ